jgi:hypothetical protein
MKRNFYGKEAEEGRTVQQPEIICCLEYIEAVRCVHSIVMTAAVKGRS